MVVLPFVEGLGELYESVDETDFDDFQLFPIMVENESIQLSH
jgi:hypothetical protein